MGTVETVFKVTASVIGSNAIKQLADQIDKTSKSGDRLKGTLTAGVTALRAFASIEVARTIGNWVEHNIELADSLNDLRQKTGIAVEDLAKYKGAAENSGTSLETLAKGINKLNKNIVDSRDGTGPAIAAFRAIGISVQDLKKMNADDVIRKMADVFEKFPDGPQKSAIAMALMGSKIGSELIPMLNEGTEGLDKFNLKVDSDFARAADNFNDKLGGMRTEFTQFGLDTAKTLLPAIDNAVESFRELFSQGELGRQFGIVTQEAVNAVTISIAAFVTALRGAITTIKSLYHLIGTMSVMGQPGVHTGTPFADFDKEFFGGLTEDFRPLMSIIEKTGKQSVITGDSGAAYWNNVMTTGRRNKPSAGMSDAFNSYAGSGSGSGGRDQRKIDEFLAKQREGIRALQDEALYVGKTTIEVDKLKDARKFETEVAEKAATLKGAMREKFLQEAEAIKQTRQELLQLNYERSRSFGTGVANFFAKFQEDATNSAEQVKKVLTDTFQGAEDAFVDFVKTGKVSFKSLASSIIEDLARIAFRRATSGLFDGLVSSLFGGIGGAVGAPMNILPGRASGGPVAAGTPYLVGERGPEPFVPMTNGFVLPNAFSQMMRKGAGGSTMNNVSVSVNISGSDSVNADSKAGVQLGQRVAGLVKAILIDEKRNGGLLGAV